MAFDYKFPVPPSDPNCKSKFARGFQHKDWVDGQDTVQAERTDDEEGLNARLHQVERDLDALGANLASAFACIEILRGQLVQALTDVKNQFNAKPPKEGKDTKEFKDVKDTKDAKDSKDTKDSKDSKDHKDGKERKDGKEGLGAIEKQLDTPAPFASGLASFLWSDATDREHSESPPLGRAFIQPDERPFVGLRVTDPASKPDER